MGESVRSVLRHEVPAESDEQLTDRARSGDQSAFGELYRRHRKAAESTAWCLLRSKPDADDVVSDVFTGVLSALRNGWGPRDNFRRYLLACVRNGCRKRRPRTVPLPDERLDRFAPDERLDRPASLVDDPERCVEADTVARAFASLAPRWQHTLWLTEVEQRPANEVSEQMNLSPNATAALAHRARQAFAVAYLAKHVGAVAGTECTKTAPLLAAYVRGNLGGESLLEVERHLVRCCSCATAASDLRDVNASLRSLIPAAPLAAFAAGATTVTKATATTASMSAASLGAASAGLSGGILAKGLVAALLIGPAFGAGGSAHEPHFVQTDARVASVAVEARSEPVEVGSPANSVAAVVTVPAGMLDDREGAPTSDLSEQPADPDRPSGSPTLVSDPAADGSDAGTAGPIPGVIPSAVEEAAAVVSDTVPPLLTSDVGPISPPIVQILQPVSEPLVDGLDKALAVMGLGPTGETVRLLASLVPLLDHSLVDAVVDGLLGSGAHGAATPVADPMTVGAAGDQRADGAGPIAASHPAHDPRPVLAQPTELVHGVPVSIAVAIPVTGAPASAAPSSGVPAVDMPSITMPSITLPSISLPDVTLPDTAGLLLGVPVVSIPPISVPIAGIPVITLPVIGLPLLSSTAAG